MGQSGMPMGQPGMPMGQSGMPMGQPMAQQAGMPQSGMPMGQPMAQQGGMTGMPQWGSPWPPSSEGRASQCKCSERRVGIPDPDREEINLPLSNALAENGRAEVDISGRAEVDSSESERVGQSKKRFS